MVARHPARHLWFKLNPSCILTKSGGSDVFVSYAAMHASVPFFTLVKTILITGSVDIVTCAEPVQAMALVVELLVVPSAVEDN